MSNSQWHGGKGDISRVTNVSEYRKNWEKIFGQKNKGYNLFLDDYRVPEKAYLHDSGCYLLEATSLRSDDWVVVRSYKKFVEAINTRGIPDVVSFDNDLNSSHMILFEKALECGYFEWENTSESGIHCAIYLRDKCKELKVSYPTVYVHSANHFARPVIRDIFKK